MYIILLTSSFIQVREIPVELQKLFVRLLLLNQQSAEVNALTNSFGWKSNEVQVTIIHLDVE